MLCRRDNLDISIGDLVFIISLMGQYRHNQSRRSTGHGIGVLVKDKLSD